MNGSFPQQSLESIPCLAQGLVHILLKNRDFLFSLINLGMGKIFAQELCNHIIPVSEAIFKK